MGTASYCKFGSTLRRWYGGPLGSYIDDFTALLETLECELLDRCQFKTRAEARLAVFEYIEGWYNTHRLHSALGYLSPVNFERRSMGRITQDQLH